MGKKNFVQSSRDNPENRLISIMSAKNSVRYQFPDSEQAARHQFSDFFKYFFLLWTENTQKAEKTC